jgi:hypothetical protein
VPASLRRSYLFSRNRRSGLENGRAKPSESRCEPRFGKYFHRLTIQKNWHMLPLLDCIKGRLDQVRVSLTDDQWRISNEAGLIDDRGASVNGVHFARFIAASKAG